MYCCTTLVVFFFIIIIILCCRCCCAMWFLFSLCQRWEEEEQLYKLVRSGSLFVCWWFYSTTYFVDSFPLLPILWHDCRQSSIIRTSFVMRFLILHGFMSPTYIRNSNQPPPCTVIKLAVSLFSILPQRYNFCSSLNYLVWDFDTTGPTRKRLVPTELQCFLLLLLLLYPLMLLIVSTHTYVYLLYSYT